MQEIILFEKVRNGAYVYMKSDLTSCRRYLMSRPPYLWDANLVTQRAGVERNVIKLRKDRDRDRLQCLSLFFIFLQKTLDKTVKKCSEAF